MEIEREKMQCRGDRVGGKGGEGGEGGNKITRKPRSIIQSGNSASTVAF